MSTNYSRNADNFSERLQAAMKAAGITHSDLARAADTAWSTVDRWFKGSIPRSKMIRELSQILGVASRWLETGEGDMQLQTPTLREDPGVYRVKKTPSFVAADQMPAENFGPEQMDFFQTAELYLVSENIAHFHKRSLTEHHPFSRTYCDLGLKILSERLRLLAQMHPGIAETINLPRPERGEALDQEAP